MIQCWFIKKGGMMEVIFCGKRYEYRAYGLESRCGLWDYVTGWSGL